MKLSIKGLALASAILWGVAMLGMGLANLVWGSYGQQFLQLMASVYPATTPPVVLVTSSLGLFTDSWTVLSVVRFLLGSTTSLLSRVPEQEPALRLQLAQPLQRFGNGLVGSLDVSLDDFGVSSMLTVSAHSPCSS
jgi:hypothetical protein